MKTVIRNRRVAILCGLILLAAVPASGDITLSYFPPHWTYLCKGIYFSLIRANQYCRKGNPEIALVRLESSNVTFKLRHFSIYGAEKPMTVEKWQKATGSTVVLNGSQYYPNLRPMGWFIDDGKNIGTSLIKSWKGLLAADPKLKGLPFATVIDLKENPHTLDSLPFNTAVQSMMLLDAHGNLRTRKSNWIANRSVIAEDNKKRILVFCTEGGYTLWEMARLLTEGPLDIRRAMVLDGGFETQMAIHSGKFSYLLYGQWSINDAGDRSMPGIHRALPSVICIDPTED